MSHASSAFFASPFNEALIITTDGVGEWATTAISIGKGNSIKTVQELHFPHSLGLLYSSFTQYLGFKVNSGEYKVMGLAPYGKPIYKKLILEKLIDLKDDGSFRIDQNYFDYATGLSMINKKFVELFGHPARVSETETITKFHMNIAASIQSITEDIVLKIAKYASKKYNLKNLCLAGGVALNCVANGKIIKNKIFQDVWIQPAAGDAGGSLGACLSLWYQKLKNKRNLSINKTDIMMGSYLGPSFSDDEIKNILDGCGALYKKVNDKELYEIVSNEIVRGGAVGWFQGRMEFGPRALGNRSILADPRSQSMQKNLNLKVKFRESFRPFAPSIIYEDLADWFELNCESPYMLLVDQIKNSKKINIHNNSKNQETGFDLLNVERSTIPAVTHVDFSARIQTVHKDTNKKFYALIECFKKKTGCPILVNTSFNVRGEPMVLSPSDAYQCFIGTGLDMLVIENYVMIKKDQFKSKQYVHSNQFNLD